MKIKFFLEKKTINASRFYLFPRWLNCISWEPRKHQTQVWRWLFFGWLIKF
jgi:hypothetical protein